MPEQTSKHTPGPWLLNTDSTADPWIIWGPKGPGRGIVAHLNPWCQLPKQEEERKLADAKLISRAWMLPDLVEALERCVSQIEGLCSRGDVPDEAREALSRYYGQETTHA